MYDRLKHDVFGRNLLLTDSLSLQNRPYFTCGKVVSTILTNSCNAIISTGIENPYFVSFEIFAYSLSALCFVDAFNKLAKSSKSLSPPQADGVLRNFAPSGTDFAKALNPRSKLRGIQ